MTDPLAEIVTLLQPRAPFSKVVGAAGRWRVQRTMGGQPFYFVILEGASRLEVDGHDPINLEQGDFVLIPAAYHFGLSSCEPPPQDVVTTPVAMLNGQLRLGLQEGPAEVAMLVGHCVFGSPDAALLVPLLPRLVHIRGEKRLANLVQMVSDESRAQRPAREVILERLLEVLLIEAFRSMTGSPTSQGLVQGLADERLSVAIRRMHESPKRDWTIAQLAKEAALSRSAFFERFNRVVGLAPMAYLLAWRMALAKRLLRENGVALGEIAEHVGYRSASAFSVAFTRHVGIPPSRYAREDRDAYASPVGV